MYLLREMSVLPLLLMVAMWGLGGCLLAARLYLLDPRERGLVGLGLGMVLSNWTANFLVRWFPMPAGAWMAAGLILALGILLAYPIRRDLRGLLRPSWGHWLAWAALTALLTLIGRGLAIFDDYQNLPILSRIAAGDIPPHFPFSADLRMGYHYFLLLLAAQVMRVADAGPWTALDLVRGMTSSLTLLLMGFFAYRLIRKPVAEFAAVVVGAFAGGTRWLLLLLPPSLVTRISANIQMIGSGARSGSSLADALTKPWDVVGSGPVPFPFAYVSGVSHPVVLALSGTGVGFLMVILLLLLLGDRARNKASWLPFVILFASAALLNEPSLVLIAVGFVGIAVWEILRGRTLRIPPALGVWLGSLLLAGLLALIQGGMFTELARGFLSGASAGTSYFQVAFHLVWPPTVISSHLGYLSLLNPYQLVPALLEFGPLALVFPLALLKGLRARRESNWLEAGWIFSGALSALMVFVQYSGNAGPTATTRLYSNFIAVCLLYAVPLLWEFTERRRHPAEIVALLIGLVTIWSGMVLFSVEVYAAARPVPSFYLSGLDVQMYRRHWDTLEPEAMVFDPNPARSVTIFGRPLDSSLDFGTRTQEYLELVDNPDPYRLQAAGYAYLYFDLRYWREHQGVLGAPCVRVIDRVDDMLGNTGEVGDFRSLADIRACR
ncbi:MAG: hypothetical protein AB1449_11130 [Chloroflexota bacterium]